MSGEKKGHPEASKYLSITTTTKTTLSASISGRILLFLWNADSITNKEVEPPDRCPPGLGHLSQINVSLGNLWDIHEIFTSLKGNQVLGTHSQ